MHGKAAQHTVWGRVAKLTAGQPKRVAVRIVDYRGRESPKITEVG